MPRRDEADERVLILAPRGRDAEVMHQVLTREGFACLTVASVEQMTAALQAGAAAAVIAEEALFEVELRPLRAWLDEQAPWSDFPFVVLVSKQIGIAAHPARKRLDELGNIVLLERPLNAETLSSATLSARRGRRRQYQAREVLADRARTTESLRHSQAELLALNETLETRIEERTRALAQANDRLMNEVIEKERVQQSLLQFQKMEAIGRLTGGIAHDFNNLLNVIQGSMDLILFASTDEMARRKAEVARRACDRGGKLTSQLLAFSRNQRLDLRAVHVREIFDGVKELMAASLGSGIRLGFDIDPQVDLVMADTNQMEMALLNLAINARDAMPDGGNITIAARSAAPPDGLVARGSYVCIAVTDDGDGIDEDTIAKVFEPFFTTKAVGKGTGLGLSQVYGMAQQSGGTARIHSQKGHGTTVEIWLKADGLPEAADGGEAAQAQADSPARVKLPAALHGVRILVVEDDKVVRQSMVELLETLGYQVSQAIDGEDGLRQLHRERPHLMITDYLMPGMTGAELVDQANQHFPGLPMIIVTGYADMQAIDKVIGPNSVLRKPFKLVELAASVDLALTRHAGSAAAVTPLH